MPLHYKSMFRTAFSNRWNTRYVPPMLIKLCHFGHSKNLMPPTLKSQPFYIPMKYLPIILPRNLKGCILTFYFTFHCRGAYIKN